ncbi:MAG: hypothetical protein FJ272_21185 [Planctomycetes bacterium]|nr:hypothetical protein [Planctomycetota bacterium]
MRRGILAAVLGVAVSVSAFGAEMSWDDQLREMGYWIVHLSTINAVNGLNLSREQAVKLQALAKQVESAGAKAPLQKGAMHPDFMEVRKTYAELRSLLLRGEDVPASFEPQVAKARKLETDLLAASLAGSPAAGPSGSCQRCHAAPSKAAKAGGRESFRVPLMGMQANSAAGKESADYAHVEGLYGKALPTLKKVSSQTQALLTDGQREIVNKFACCLIPPKGLSDPVRAGQAAVSEGVLDLLKKVRACPASYWPTAKEGVLQLMARGHQMKHPGATEAERKERRDQVAAVLEKARAASDVEFEMNKEALCTELKGDPVRKASDEQLAFKTAYFLLSPGSADIYAAVLRRLATQKAGL